MAKSKKVSVQDALWRGILDDREDDLSRLAYADWLEENGEDARSLFIRLQVEQATLDEHEPRHWQLESLIRRLWHANEQVWRTEVPTWCRGDITFRRGFPYQLTATANALLRSGRPLLRKQPIGSLQIVRGTEQEIREILSWPEIPSLRKIGLFAREISLRVCEELGHSPHFSGLRELLLRGLPFQTDTVEALAGPALVNLEHLFWENWVSELRAEDTTRQAASIANASWTRLRSLTLRSLQLSPSSVAALASGSALTELHHLDLSTNPVQDAGIEALTRAAWPHLTRLDLSVCGFSQIGVEHLLGWSRLPALRWLDLSHTGRPATLMATTPFPLALVHLAVSNLTGDEGFAALANSHSLPALKSLRYCNNGLTASGVRLLKQANALSGLERLDLSMNFFGDKGGQHLLDSQHLESLSWLDVGLCDLSAGLLQALTNRFPHVNSW